MRKLDIFNGITRSLGTVSLELKKHSPAILVTAGIAGGVVSAIMACRATLKVDEVLENTKTKVEKVHTCMEQYPDEYTEADAKKDLVKVYAHAGLDFAKVYGPAVLLGTASITSILVGYNILNKRNVALAAACTAAMNDFKGYRSRVIERFGKELDRELKYNIKTEEIEERVVDEDGN